MAGLVRLGAFLMIMSLCVGLGVADKKTFKMTVKNYCESWKLNVEINNIRNFPVVPNECVDTIGKYMTSPQYIADIGRTLEEAVLYVSKNFILSGDGKDAWVFDIDETLLSTVPYYSLHHFGGQFVNKTDLAAWMNNTDATALEPTLNFYNHIKARGIKIFLISSRSECLREATVANLINQGYNGWTGLFLKDDGLEGSVQEYKKTEHGKMCMEISECLHTVQEYMLESRSKLIADGFRIWGNVGSQWSSILGYPNGFRTFKLSNPMYYVA